MVALAALGSVFCPVIIIVRRSELCEVDFGFGDTLRHGPFQPTTRFAIHRSGKATSAAMLSCSTAGEIAAEHQLGMAVAQFRGGAER